MQPITDTAIVVTATVYSTLTTNFLAKVNLTHCAGCENYQRTINLPADMPIGRYYVEYAASHPDYDSAQATSVFFVSPPLTMTLESTPTISSWEDRLTLIAQVYDRETAVTEAGIWAEITTASGVVTVPLLYDGDVYSTTFRPVELKPSLDGNIIDGQWEIRAVADYYGSSAKTSTIITVSRSSSIYLPLVLRNYSSGSITSPASPSNLAATSVSQTQVNLSWIDNSNNENGFKIERSINDTSNCVKRQLEMDIDDN